jgi:hypothetical protein
MKREFKVGDKVRVIETGREAKIIRTGNAFDWRIKYKDGIEDLFCRDELKHLKPKLTEKRIREIVREMIEEKMPYKWKVDLSILDEEMKRKYLNDAKPYLSAGALHNCEPIKEQKPKSGWYKDTEHDEWMVFSNFENNSYFGINCSNEWVDEIAIGKIVLKDNEIPATNEEVIARLVDYIKSKNK